MLFHALMSAASVLLIAGSDPADLLLGQAVGDARATNVQEVDAGFDVERALQEEREAELELMVSAARLGALKARARLAQAKYDEAIELAGSALEAVARLPASVDRTEYLEPLLEVLRAAEAGRAGKTPRTPTGATLGEFAPPLDRPTGPTPQQRYYPDRVRFDEEEANTQDAERYYYEADARRLYKADEADALARMAEDRRIPKGWLVYPDDWAELSQRRARFRDGILWQGPEFRDDDGELRRTVVYDVGALLMDVPNFTGAPILDLAMMTQFIHDRAALRQHSQIFTGYAHELAEGIPLLRYFGGVDENHLYPSGTGERYSELLHLIDRVVEQN